MKLNQVIILGRLVKDPELRYIQSSGNANTRFTLAVDRNLSKDKKQEMESKGQPTADFIPVVVWGKQAEHCANYLKKGRLVAVHGSIQTGSYEKDGQRIYTTDVLAQQVQFLERGDSQGQQQQNQPQAETHTISDDAFPF